MPKTISRLLSATHDGDSHGAWEQLKTITDTLPALVSYVDADRVYRLVNRQYLAKHGTAARDAVGKHVWDVLGLDGYRSVKPELDRALGGEPVQFDRQIPMTSGTAWMSVSYTPDRAPDGTIRGVVVLTQDVTERKRHEAERAALFETASARPAARTN